MNNSSQCTVRVRGLAKAFGSNDVWKDKDAQATNKQNASKLEVILHVGF